MSRNKTPVCPLTPKLTVLFYTSFCFLLQNVTGLNQMMSEVPFPSNMPWIVNKEYYEEIVHYLSNPWRR